MNPELVAKHEALFKTRPALYPINRTQIKTYSIPQNEIAANLDNLFTGELPKSVYIMLVPAQALYGHLTRNPFRFHHYNTTKAFLKVNGQQVPSEPYAPDFANNRYLRVYRDFFDNIGVGHTDLSNVITPKQYGNGAFIMAFDLSPDLCNGRETHLRTSGYINFSIEFGDALPETVNIMAFAVYDGIVTISGHSKVETDIKI